MQLTRSLVRARRIQPDAVATVFGTRRRSWAELDDRVGRLAGALRATGVGSDDRVAVLSLSNDRYLEAAYATLRAGAVVVPLSTRATTEELLGFLDDVEAKVLFVGDDFLDRLPALRAGTPSLVAAIHMGDGPPVEGALDYEALVAEAAPAPDAGRGGGDVAMIYFTGGTTGRGKGVMLTHANIYANAMQSLHHFDYDERTVYLHSGPLYHLAAGSRLFTNTLLGATHVFVPRFSPDVFFDAVAAHRITMTALVPTMMSMILQHPRFETADLSSLDLVTYGGAPMPEALIGELVRRLPHVRFGQAYGMTELSPACTYLEPRHHRLDEAGRHLLRSAGRPAVGCDVRVVDHADRDVPVGEIGEIVVSGPIVMKGYWRQPELTAEVLRGGYMHTGDVGRFDEDGFLYVVDRLKDMIITGGENVYSIEVETAIRSHPDVVMCAVIGIPDEKWGEAVHAVVVARPGASLAAEAIVDHCRARIAAFKVPRSVEFRDELPLTAANKIQKSELRRPFRADAPRGTGRPAE